MYHSQTPQSKYEMKTHGVLENNIDVHEISSIAEAIGFSDCMIAALCRPLLDLGQHHALLKGDFKPDLTNKFMKEMQRNGINKNIFFLHKGPLLLDSRSVEGLQGNLEVLSSNFYCREGKSRYLKLRICISNMGSSIWLAHSKSEIGVVYIGAHLLDRKNNILSFDWKRFKIPRRVDPGDQLIHEIIISFPSDLQGSFRLSFDLVSESICWFEQLGHKPVLSEIFCL